MTFRESICLYRQTILPNKHSSTELRQSRQLEWWLAKLGDIPLAAVTRPVTVNGIPLHQLGTSQQIVTAVQIAAALNPRSAIVCIDGAESMGTADRAALAQVAKELGLQLIMTFVDEDAEPGEGVTVMRAGEAVAV